MLGAHAEYGIGVVAERAAWPVLRQDELRALPLDRQGDAKPAEDRPAVPRLAHPLSDRIDRRSARRRHLHRPPEHARVPARARPDQRSDLVHEDTAMTDPKATGAATQARTRAPLPETEIL